MIQQVIDKYTSMSKPAKASLWFAVSNIVNKGIVFLTTPLFTRILSKEEYGIISLYSTWLAFLTIIITFNLATGVFNKAMMRYEDDRDGYTSSSLTLMTILVGIFFAVYFPLRQFWNSIFGLETIFVVMIYVEIFFSTTWDLYAIRKRFEYSYKTIVFVTIISNILANIFSLFLTLKIPSHRAEARILGILLTHVIIYGFFYVLILKNGKKYVVKTYWKFSINYNLPLIPHYLSQQVLNQSDRIMISKICGNADAGVYSLAYQLASAMQILTNAIHVSFMPWCFQRIKDGGVKRIGKRAFQIEASIGVICLVFSLFAPELIWILGGNEYYKSIYIVPPVSMSILFITIYSFFGNFEFYYERTKIVMIASGIVALANIILNLIFIPICGFIAAGYTTLFCYIIYSFVHYIFVKRICKENGIPSPFNEKLIWGYSMMLVFVSIMVSFLYKFILLRYLIILTLLFVLFLFVRKSKKILFS